jgi:adenosine deaminase
MSEGVVALGLGGAEQGHPPEPYAPYFEKAWHAGLHSVPHAGETVGPESVWGALHALGAERLGHGVRSIEDPQLVAHLKERQIPLELCPTSNLCLGVYRDIAAHPFRLLHAADIPVTVNSDDPPLFNTDLNHEVGLLFDAFSFDIETANDILLNGVRYSFLPDERKQAMEAEFRAEMTRLRQELEL